MLGHLLESRPQRSRTRSAAILSLVVHATLVGSAVAATGTIIEPPDEVDRIGDLVYLPPRPKPSPPTTAPRRPLPPVAPDAPQLPGPVVVAPVEVPDGVVPQDPATPSTGEPTFHAPAVGGEGGDPAATNGSTGAGNEPYFPDEVEKAARPIGRQREPRYPDLLRAQRIEGQVIVTYVVDSLGRVEPASIRMVESAHALFEPAVRQAVMATRFRPAEWRGRKVRQLVQQSYVFTLMR